MLIFNRNSPGLYGYTCRLAPGRGGVILVIEPVVSFRSTTD